MFCGRLMQKKEMTHQAPAFHTGSPQPNLCNLILIFSSTGRRPASYCHCVASFRPFVRACVHTLFLSPITRRHILDSSKLKKFADDNFKFDENGRKLSKQVENTVGKGEIARYEQFLLFPQCFQKACFLGASKGVIVWEWVKTLLRNY